MSKKLLLWITGIIGASILIFGTTFITVQSAIQQVAGLAVAQSATLWNNVKDGNVGDNLTSGLLASALFVFDGTNFDRARGDTANGLDVDVTKIFTQTGTTISDAFANPTNALVVSSLLSGFNGTTWDRILTQGNNADAVSVSTLGVQKDASFNYGFNGTTWDRLLSQGNNASGVSVSTLGVGKIAAFNYAFNGVTWDRIQTAAFTVDGFSLAGVTGIITGDVLFGFNGTTFDRIRVGGDDAVNPSLGKLFTLSARANAVAPTFTEGRANPLSVDLNGNLRVTASGGGTITVTGNKTPAEGFTNPTDAINSWSLLGLFNGTTWDRALNSIHADDLTTSRGLNTASFNYEFDGTDWDRVRNQFSQNTVGVLANGAGTTISMVSNPMKTFSMQIDRTAGATDVVEIDLECSLDNVAFTQIATILNLANEPVIVSHEGTPCSRIRYNVVTIGAGNTVNINILAMR